MDQMKIGSFIRELRKEKDLTQEQLAEKMNTSRRTVSRWETGTSMPDLSVLVDLAEFFEIDLKELFDGQRKENTLTEIQETVIKAAEYSNEEMSRKAMAVCMYFVFGLISLVVHEVLGKMNLEGGFWLGFLDGATFGMSFAAMGFGIILCLMYMKQSQETKQRIYKKLQSRSE